MARRFESLPAQPAAALHSSFATMLASTRPKTSTANASLPRNSATLRTSRSATGSRKMGLNTNDKGGDVQIVPMANPDQLTLFLKKDLDAAWAPEPWATRLIHEGNGRLFVDERTLWPNGQFVIGLLVVNTKFLNAHPDLVKNWITRERRSHRLD